MLKDETGKKKLKKTKKIEFTRLTRQTHNINHKTKLTI